MPSEAVLVLGMHRSGTSAMSGVLSLLGVNFGENLLGPMPENAKGFFEHVEILGLDERILWQRCSSWDDPRAPLSAAVAEPVDEIAAILARDFAKVPLWGLKDPRISILIPEYVRVLDRMEVTLRPVLMLRSPVAVAASLRARDGITADEAGALWIAHTLMPMQELGDRGLLPVSYDALMEDPEELRWVATALGVPRGGDAQSALDRAFGFLDGELRHHRAAGAEAAGSGSCSPNLRLAQLGYERLVAARRDPAALAAATAFLLESRGHLDIDAAIRNYWMRRGPDWRNEVDELRRIIQRQEEGVDLIRVRVLRTSLAFQVARKLWRAVVPRPRRPSAT